VRGQGAFLDDHSAGSGVTELSECRVHWWILDESEARAKASELVNVGHVATLYQDELYEMRTGRAGVTRLHQFGVIFGYDRVVLYIEPLNGPERPLTANTARTQLLRDGASLPYAEWAADFRAAMPQEIKDHMDAVIAGSRDSNHQESIAERLRHYSKLFRLSRYRAKPDGRLSIAEPVLPRRKPAQDSTTAVEEADSEPRKRPKQDSTGRLLAAMLAEAGEPAEDVSSPRQDLPRVTWISAADETRAPGFLDDRAAKFLIEDNMIQANADFRGFTDMAEYWCEQYSVDPGNRAIQDVVHEWFEQALVETVIGCQALQGERLWSPRDIEIALSEEALTAAVMQRYHVANSIKRTLGAKLGSLREKIADGSAAT
jgi:hypothetical protein